MTWSKVSDDRWRDPRLNKLGDRRLPAIGLHNLAESWSAANGTDGYVPRKQLLGLALEEASMLAAALVDAGWWAAENDGYRIVDYLRDNPSAAEIAERKAERHEITSKAGKARARAPRGPDGRLLPSIDAGGHAGRQPASIPASEPASEPAPSPVSRSPTEPLPETRTQSARARGQVSIEDEFRRIGIRPPRRPNGHAEMLEQLVDDYGPERVLGLLPAVLAGIDGRPTYRQTVLGLDDALHPPRRRGLSAPAKSNGAPSKSQLDEYLERQRTRRPPPEYDALAGVEILSPEESKAALDRRWRPRRAVAAATGTDSP